MRTDETTRFIGIGAVKCATTWIARCLSSHPEICMPAQKELKFFNRKDQYSRGIERYLKQFSGCEQEKCIGEFTPRYLHDGPDVAKRIHDAFPEAKLIVCLRDPIERAVSHYAYAKRKHNETAARFEEAIETRSDYIEWGLYNRELKPYLDLFPPERILILQFEKIKGNEREFMKTVYRFLEVDENHVSPFLGKQVNKTTEKAYRFSLLNKAVSRTKNYLRNKSWGYRVLKVIQSIGLSKLATILLTLNRQTPANASAGEGKPTLSEETKAKLCSFFEEDVRLLNQHTDIDTSLWLKQ